MYHWLVDDCTRRGVTVGGMAVKRKEDEMSVSVTVCEEEEEEKAEAEAEADSRGRIGCCEEGVVEREVGLDGDAG